MIEKAITKPITTFADLGLRTGDRLILEFTHGQRRYPVKLIGYLPDASLLVTSPMRNGKEVLIEKDETIQVRSFVRDKVCAFQSRVIYRAMQPFPHYHLAYPAELEALQIRKSERHEVSLPAIIDTEFDIGAGDWPKQGQLSDLSTSGAALRVVEPLGEPGHELMIDVTISVDGIERTITIGATIRNREVVLFEDREGYYQYGIQFLRLAENDFLLISHFLRQVRK